MNEGPTEPAVGGVAAVAKFLIYSTTAMLTPSEYWRAVSRLIAFLSNAFRPGRRRSDVKRTLAILGDRISPLAARRAEHEKSVTAFHTAILTLGQRYANGRQQTVRTFGLDHIHAALEAGNGVILWVCPFSYARLVSKMGLSREGIDLFHLSRSDHGFGKSAIARKYLNRLWVAGENRYLKERLVMTEENEIGALRTLRKRLRKNQVVTITLGISAAKVRTVPFLSGTMTAAIGPPGLAISTGAAILPVFSVRADNGDFVVTVDKPLTLRDGVDRDEKSETMLSEIAQRLEPRLVDNVGQWGNWSLFHPPSPN
jgi:lauroyl/myristoyl acyltransferase